MFTFYSILNLQPSINKAQHPQGEPFMEGLRDNKPLLYSILVSGGTVLALAAGIIPDLSTAFEIVYFPPDVSIIGKLGIYRSH